MFIQPLRKIGYGLSIVLGVAVVVFFLFHLSAADPVRSILGENVSEDVIENTRKKWHLDESLSVQFLTFLHQLSPLSIHPNDPQSNWYIPPAEVTGWKWNVGADHFMLLKLPYLSRSYISGESVNTLLAESLPATMLLAVISTLLASLIGIGLGVWSAIRVNTLGDRLILTLSSLGMSAPSFFVAVFFAWLFAVHWRETIAISLLPMLLAVLVGGGVYGFQRRWKGNSRFSSPIWPFGMAMLAWILSPAWGVIELPGTQLPLTGSLYELDPWEGKIVSFQNMILPMLTLMIRPLGVVVQLTRNSILEVLSQDFIRTAYAKGLSPARVMWKHALPNALNPVLTSISGWFASLLAGAVFVEFVFGWKGLGQLMFTAIERQDLPVISGGVMVIATAFVLIGFLMDGVYRWLDPRVR